jgi:hypothetical protein
VGLANDVEKETTLLQNAVTKDQFVAIDVTPMDINKNSAWPRKSATRRLPILQMNNITRLLL